MILTLNRQFFIPVIKEVIPLVVGFPTLIEPFELNSAISSVFAILSTLLPLKQNFKRTLILFEVLRAVFEMGSPVSTKRPVEGASLFFERKNSKFSPLSSVSSKIKRNSCSFTFYKN